MLIMQVANYLKVRIIVSYCFEVTKNHKLSEYRIQLINEKSQNKKIKDIKLNKLFDNI